MRSVTVSGMFCGAAVAVSLISAAEPVPVRTLITRIQAVGKEGSGNTEAARAWKALVARGPEVLPALLAAMDDEHVTTSNWLRTAIDAVAERTLQQQGKLPVDELQRFIATTTHSACARRLAYEWLTRADPKTPDRLLPQMLHDPSPELRRDAVARAMKEADAVLTKGDKKKTAAAYRRALSGACDQDQVDTIAKQLKTLGEPVDLVRHFGLVKSWYLAGPFDNTAGAGFAQCYLPEKGVDLQAVYKGKAGADVRWSEHATADPYGAVDLNKAIAKHKDAVAYAFTVLEPPAARQVQIRLGCINASKIFVNGKEVFGRDEYHHGMRLDQYICKAKLRAGRNELLLKICQNNQNEPWAQDWKFQARLTDFAGAAVPWNPVPLRISLRVEGEVTP